MPLVILGFTRLTSADVSVSSKGVCNLMLNLVKVGLFLG